MPNHVEATYKTVQIISDVTPNICKWTWVQCADLKAKLPIAVKRILAKNSYNSVGVLQESFRRNDKEVDEEVRAALVAKMNDDERGRSNADLTMEQVSFFNPSIIYTRY